MSSTVGDQFPIWVPDETTDLVPLATPFTNLANSVAGQLNHIKAQSTSIITRSDVINGGTGWSINSQRLTIAAEVVAVVYIEFKRTGAAISAGSSGTSGNLTNVQLGSMISGYNAQSEVPLTSGATGRGAHGHILHDGGVWLDSISGTNQIATNDVISLGGAFVLDNPIPSGL